MHLRPLLLGTLSLTLVVSCGGYEPPPCPGLPETIPSDWAVTPPGLDTAAFDAQMAQRLREGCIPSIAVSVVTAEGPLLTASWGYANLETLAPATTSTPYMLASVSKAFDAVAIQVAREQGLVDLEDRVSDLVGFEVENRRIGGGPPILLKHLVTHSSGIRDNYEVYGQSYVDGDSPIALGDYLTDYLLPGGSRYRSKKNFHLWPAGRETYYSNVGATLAAYAVEVQSGMSFADYSRMNVLEPMGMDGAGWFLADFPDPELVARPHKVTAEGWQVIEHFGYPTYPDGQLRASIGDAAKLLRVVLGEGVVDGRRVLSEASAWQLVEEPVPGLADWYQRPGILAQGIFWFTMGLNGRRIVGHDGDDNGVSSEVFYDPEIGVGVALVTNITDGGEGSRVRDQTLALQELLFELGEDLR